MIFDSPVGQAGLGQDDLAAAEGVGLDGVAADGQEALVDFLDDVRPAEVEDFGDVFLAQPVALQIERIGVQSGPHRPVENDDALPHQI